MSITKSCSNCGARLSDEGNTVLCGKNQAGAVIPTRQSRGEEFGPSAKAYWDTNTCPCCEQESLQVDKTNEALSTQNCSALLGVGQKRRR